ncbi:MAG: ScyD/ScyE family protein [Pseudomonadales bacterium]
MSSVGSGAVGVALWLLVGLGLAGPAWSNNGAAPPHGQVLASGLQGAGGSTVGPDGALYVVEGAIGQVTRINPYSGRKRTFAKGLPPALGFVGIGGAIDVAFIDRTAYVLVTLVGDPLFNGDSLPGDGVYRVNSRHDVELIADLGLYSAANPPTEPFFYFLVHGVHYAMQRADQGFLVADGHLNRILHVTLDGGISVLKQYENIVPTGLAGDVGTLYVGQLGAYPNPAEEGKVIALGLLTPDAGRTIAAGVPMIVDVEFGPHGDLYALSQGNVDLAADPGAPALPNTGRLLRVKRDGSYKVLADRLDRPTSLSFIGHRAYVVTLPGDVLLFRRVGHGRY